MGTQPYIHTDICGHAGTHRVIHTNVPAKTDTYTYTHIHKDTWTHTHTGTHRHTYTHRKMQT